MKKILLIATVVASLSGLTAFGQGNFKFATGAGYVWNPVTGTRGGSYYASFLFGDGTPAIGTATGLLNASTNAVPSFSGVNPWASITTDPNFTLAVNDATHAAVVGTLTAAGGVSYNGGSDFKVTGTLAGGGTTTVFMIAWDNAYATPALAALGGAAVGWSKPFPYTYAAATGSASGNFSLAAVTAGVGAQFGVAPIPEPATFALAGLGLAAMLVSRRRK